MSNTALQNLKNLFHNRPDVLRMLDLRELDLIDLESQELINKQKNIGLFPELVNLYATGRTGAGKTSLGNRLLDSGEAPMESHGHQDCTSSVQYFALASNLHYFDLPGAGSDETYENINRSALLIEQIKYEDVGITPITEFKFLDFSNYQNQGVQEKTITVEQWQLDKNQELVSPDIILYVVAPHMQFIRGDSEYLSALLKSLKGRSNKVIFALNIYRTKDGTPMPTPQTITDAKKRITKIYQSFYIGENPLIVEIDSLKGTGITQIADFMCRILPPNKIGNMEQVLRGELKELAKKERSRRYRQALIHVASRLATYPVDTSIGKGIVEEAYAAICDYGMRIFKEERVYIEASKQLDKVVNDFATQAKISREKAVKIIISDVEEKEVTNEEIVGYNPEYKDVKVEENYIDYEERRNDVNSSPSTILAEGVLAGLLSFGATLLTGMPIMVPPSMMSGGRTEKELEPVVKTRTKIEQRLVGMKEERKAVTKKVPYTVQKEKEVGKQYLQGGYPVIENLLAIGLGIENIDPSEDLRNSFEARVKAGQDQVRIMLDRYEEQINQLAESSSTPEKAQKAEEQIIEILKQAIMN